MQGGAEVCEGAVVEEVVGAQLADPVWRSFAEVGQDDVAGLVSSWVVKVTPDTNSELAAKMAFGNVGNAWLTISVALVDDETSVLRCLGPVVEGVGVPVGEDGQLGRVGGLGLLSGGADPG